MKNTLLLVCFVLLLSSCTQTKNEIAVEKQDKNTETVQVTSEDIDEKIADKQEEKNKNTQKKERIANATAKIELDKKNGLYYIDRADIYSSYAEHNLAKQDYEQAAALLQNDAQNVSYIGGQLYDMGFKEIGISYQKQAQELAPEDDVVNYALARTYYWEGDYEQALSLIEKSLAVVEDLDGYNLKGNILDAQGDGKGAIETYKKALTFTGDLAMVYENLGNSYYFLGDYEQAIESYSLGLQEEGSEERALYTEIAYTYTIMGDYEKAYVNLQLALEKDNYFPRIHSVMGYYFLQVQDYEKSKKYFQKFIDEAQGDESQKDSYYAAKYNIALAEYNLKNYKTALEFINSLLQEKKDDPDFYTLKDDILKALE